MTGQKPLSFDTTELSDLTFFIIYKNRYFSCPQLKRTIDDDAYLYWSVSRRQYRDTATVNIITGIIDEELFHEQIKWPWASFWCFHTPGGQFIANNNNNNSIEWKWWWESVCFFFCEWEKRNQLDSAIDVKPLHWKTTSQRKRRNCLLNFEWKPNKRRYSSTVLTRKFDSQSKLPWHYHFNQ